MPPLWSRPLLSPGPRAPELRRCPERWEGALPHPSPSRVGMMARVPTGSRPWVGGTPLLPLSPPPFPSLPSSSPSPPLLPSPFLLLPLLCSLPVSPSPSSVSHPPYLPFLPPLPSPRSHPPSSPSSSRLHCHSLFSPPTSPSPSPVLPPALLARLPVLLTLSPSSPPLSAHASASNSLFF